LLSAVDKIWTDLTNQLEYEAFALAIPTLGIFCDVIAVPSFEGEATGDRQGQVDA